MRGAYRNAYCVVVAYVKTHGNYLLVNAEKGLKQIIQMFYILISSIILYV